MKEKVKKYLQAFADNGVNLVLISLLTGIFAGAVVTFYNILMSLGEEHIAELCALLQAYERAFANFQAMPQSVKKTYARAYFSAVTDAGRKKRFEWLVDRLDKNLRPM